jgi:hypothetical protein
MLEAGYGLTAEEPPEVGPIWKRGHAEWEALTRLKPMDSYESWLTAGVAAGIPTGEVRRTNRKELVERIRLWALARRAQLPPRDLPADQSLRWKVTSRRGQPPTYDTAKDAKLETDWKAAKARGSTQKEFCKARGIKHADLQAALTRNRERRNRQCVGIGRGRNPKRRKSASSSR